MTVIVAIDGPAGAGKSSIARRVAERLSMVRVDTGAIYRTVTLCCLERDIEAEDAVAALCDSINIRFDGERVFEGDREVTDNIRERNVTKAVSRIAAMPAVRAGLLELQRRLGRSHPVGAVLEGRDIGTVVFPEADVKIFLTASAEERAKRRQSQLEDAGVTRDLDEVLEDIQKRDALDSGRETAPLMQPDDAIVVDSTGCTRDDVVDHIVKLVQERLPSS